MSRSKFKRVLALATSTRGCGFAFLDDMRLANFGLKAVGSPEHRRSEKTLKIVSKLMDDHTPRIVVFEDCSAEGCRRNPRIRTLLEQISQLAAEKGIEIRKLARKQVLQYFLGRRTRPTKYELAEVLMKQFPDSLEG